MKKRIWLFFLPLLVPLLIWATRYTQSQRLTTYDVGGGHKLGQGEKIAMRKLAEVLAKKSSSERVAVVWSARFPSSIEFDGFHHRMVHIEGDTAINGVRPPMVSQYAQVTPDVIATTAAQGGTISELTQHGAQLKRRARAQFDFDRPEGLILEW